MYTGFCYISYLLIITILNKIVLANDIKEVQFKSQLNSLSLAKELITNSIFLVHFQSALTIMASERDFPFNIPTDSKLNYIRYPQSFRTTTIQFSSDMQKIFSDIYSTMYHIQLAVKRIPNHIKTILKLITAGSSNMNEKMLPTIINNIARISNENKILLNKTIDQLTNLFNFVNEIKQYTIDLSLKYNNYSSNKTDLILYNEFNSKNILEKISIIIQQMKKQYEQIVQLMNNVDIQESLNLFLNDEIIRFISILYNIENNAYYFYQLSSIHMDILNRYVLDQIASIGRYTLLSSDDERLKNFSNLSQQMSNILYEVEQLFLERQNEFEINSMTLQQAYEKLFDKFQNRSSTSKLLETK
ncbi:unnamed protein product [Rotaria sordida]|uniref:Uncharacterized protein n=1 Tax=Rotaria sordida TaxID=392033 RepID=A0A814EJE6_9BILA|nr:unnamed protein product [Rotaria sordida]